MPVSFNPINQPNTTLGSDTPLADTEDIFGLKKASPTPAPKPPTVTPFGVFGVDAKVDAFFQGGARYKEGVRMTTDSIGFKQKELALLKERIASGLSGAADIDRYMIGGKTADVVQKEIAERDAAKAKNPAIGNARNSSMGQNFERAQLNRVIEQELSARVDAYIEVIGNHDLDDETRKEFLQMYQSGAQAQDISGALKRATEGVGIYGIRKQNNASREAAMLNTATNKRQGVL